jgi:hypothetical protein
MNFAPFRPVDDLDGNEFDALACRSKSEHLFRFDFKLRGPQLNPVKGIETHQAKAALSIRELAAGQRRKITAHPAVDHSAHEGDFVRLTHSVARDQGRACSFGAFQKLSDVRGRVLTVSIHA